MAVKASFNVRVEYQPIPRGKRVFLRLRPKGRSYALVPEMDGDYMGGHSVALVAELVHHWAPQRSDGEAMTVVCRDEAGSEVAL